MSAWFRTHTILTLALLVVGLAAASARADDLPAWDAAKLIAAKSSCFVCHKKDSAGNQVAAWQASSHAKAFEALKSDKAKEVAAKLGVADPTTDGKCLKCHSTAYGFTEARVSDKVPVEEGVECQTCHGPGADYKTKHAHKKAEAIAKYGMIEPTAANTCVRCHNKDNPTFDPNRYTLKDGTKTDFDFEQANAKIAHPLPKK